MADTRGFETVVEASEAVLRKILRAAWKSAECPDAPGDESRIPEYMDIPPPEVEFDGYTVADGQIQIPQDELDARLAAGVGADLDFGLHMQFEIEDAPVPSARLFDMTATVTARAPIDTGDDDRQVFVFLERIPRSDVSATLTSAHPLDPKLDDLLTEYVHAAYENNGADPSFPTIPHTIEETDVVWSLGLGSATIDVYAELYDDPGDPAYRIEVTRPDPNTIEVSIPTYLRVYNIRTSGLAAALDLRSPMGIETRLILTAPFDSPPGAYTARLSEATATVGTITPSPYPPEGDNYTHNKAAIPLLDLDDLLRQELTTRGEQLAQDFGDFTIEVPTIAEIETAIEDFFHAELITRGAMPVWTPADSDDFTINDVTVNVRSDALVIAINASAAADVTGIAGFIPTDREFAIAIDGAKVLHLVDEARDDENLGDDDLPTRMEADGKDVDLNSLDVALTDGSLRITGEVTVIDAILGSIDVDADFEADIGLHWEPDGALNAAGVQELKHHPIGEPDVDTDAGWLVSLILGILGFLTGGLLGALIGVIIGLVIQAIASNIGSSVASDAISGLPIGVGAWPSELARVGEAQAVFQDPVIIEADGIVIAGSMEVVSSCEATAVVPADSGTAYSGTAASAISLFAGNTHPDASYGWLPGDGTAPVLVQDLTYVYVASGLYLAKHQLVVNQPGGATSRHFALVDVENVVPTVDVGPDIVVNEGEVVTLVGHFWDVEYPDTHESSWNFGDDQRPEAGVLVETNEPAQASGTTTVEHAWCDDGVYTVTLRVRDQNGGMATDARQVTVLNVPPTVDAGPERYAYPCMPITLRADFEDPGWCDTHEGAWDFGDCSPLHTAIIRETNEPPAAQGTSSAAHIYEECGTYRAVATVVDDDGGVGVSATNVHVVEIRNADFEGGFRPHVAGKVANYWEPYAASGTNLATTRATLAMSASEFPQASKRIYDCEQCVVYGGQRSQRILAPAGARFGLLQRLGANPDWRYQVSAFYSLQQPLGGTARLGIDPDGGQDPGAASIVWSASEENGDWVQLAEEVIASGDAITIFLEVEADERGVVDGYFDNVEFVAIEPHCPPEEEPEPEGPRRRCVRPERRDPPTPYVENGFTFTNRSGQPIDIVVWGQPPGALKIALSPGGLVVDLPFPADVVEASVNFAGGNAPEMTAFDAADAPIGKAVGGTESEAQTLRVESAGIVRVVITAQEGNLYELCAWTKGGGRRPDTAEAAVGPEVAVVTTDLVDPPRYRIAGLAATAAPSESGSMRARPPHLDIPAEAWEKFDQELQRAAHGRRVTAASEFPLLLTVRGDLPAAPPGVRGAELADLRERAFESETVALRRHLEKCGAHDLKALWIARAIECRAPLSAAVAAALRDDTVRISLVTKRDALI